MAELKHTFAACVEAHVGALEAADSSSLAFGTLAVALRDGHSATLSIGQPLRDLLCDLDAAGKITLPEGWGFFYKNKSSKMKGSLSEQQQMQRASAQRFYTGLFRALSNLPSAPVAVVARCKRPRSAAPPPVRQPQQEEARVSRRRTARPPAALQTGPALLAKLASSHAAFSAAKLAHLKSSTCCCGQHSGEDAVNALEPPAASAPAAVFARGPTLRSTPF